MRYAIIKDRPGIVKDLKSGAILASDEKAKEDYLAKQRALQNSNEAKTSVDELSNTVKQLQTDMAEIKALLQGLVK